MQDQINAHLKQALLGGDTQRVTVLRGLKTAITYAEVAAGKKDTGLSDEEILNLFHKEAKKRQDSADLYAQAGEPGRAEAELAEKAIIDAYLPTQLSEDEIAAAVTAVIAELGAQGQQAMGQVIGAVKAKLGQAADGATIARIVKASL